MADCDSLLHLLSLKQVLRQGWRRFDALPEAAVESVADHSYGVMLLCWLFCPKGLDRLKVLELALLHDLAEVETGDLTPADRIPTEDKHARERDAMAKLLEGWVQQGEATALLEEYQAGQTAEARFVKGVDKLDMALQSLAYERQFRVDLQEFRRSAEPYLTSQGLGDWFTR